MRQVEIVAGDDRGLGIKFVAKLIELLLRGLQLCFELLGFGTIAACGRWSWRFGSCGLQGKGCARQRILHLEVVVGDDLRMPSGIRYAFAGVARSFDDGWSLRRRLPWARGHGKSEGEGGKKPR